MNKLTRCILIAVIITAIITLVFMLKHPIPKTYIILAGSAIYVTVMTLLVISWKNTPELKDNDEN